MFAGKEDLEGERIHELFIKTANAIEEEGIRLDMCLDADIMMVVNLMSSIENVPKERILEVVYPEKLE